MPSRRSSLLVVTTLTAACSTVEAPPIPEPELRSDADGGTPVTCKADPRVDAYAPNLTKRSTSGGLDVVLLAAEPAPPARGANTWRVKVVDLGGGLPTAAPLAAKVIMLDLGHTSSETATVTDAGDETYVISPLYFAIPGIFRVTIAAGEDAVSFIFCVPG